MKNDNIELVVSVFPDTRALALTQLKSTWGELMSMIVDPPIRSSKGACQLLKMATFGSNLTPKGCIRSDANMLHIYGIEGDYDAGSMSVDQCMALLQHHGIEAMIYTSASHTAEFSRYRILVPLSRPHTPNDRRRLTAQLNYALGGVLAPESFTASQSYFFGRVGGCQASCRPRVSVTRPF